MNIINFSQIDSTNTYAKREMDSLCDKTVVCADYQTAGRGRFDRSWVNVGVENIYMTIVLKPSDIIEPNFACLTQYLSFCLCLELEKLGLSPHIKWPNDVLIEGKKVCGILAESVIKKRKLKGIALGIGVNLNADASALEEIDRPATSLNLHLKTPVDKTIFMNNLLQTFFDGYENFLENGFLSIKDFYEQHSYIAENSSVKFAVFDKIIEGVFVGFEKDGTLLLKTSDSEVKNFNMGEFVEGDSLDMF